MKGDFGTFTVPDGYSYTNADETLSFSYDYSIEYSLLSSGISREDAEKAFLEGSASDTEKTEKLLTKFFFSDMNSGPYKVTMKALRCVEKDGVLFVEAVECVDGIEVKGAKVLSALKNGEPVFLSGRLFFSKSYTDYKTDAHDSVNILFEIEKNDLKIEKMQILYIPVFEEKGSVYLTPSYSFTYSDGSEEIYDATSAIKRN
ncbi:MAG: hypothetical protein IIW20_04075, partial [Clostridia bacterium]|nr:hypothetical protein [Clostridia bacterium]